MSAAPLDLTRPRDLGALINTTFTIYARHFALFAALALGTVVVVDGIVYGIGGGWLWESYDSYDLDNSAFFGVLAFALPVLVLTPLITATHAQAVAAIGAGRVPSISEALGAGLRVFAPVLAVVLLASIGVLLGLVLLIVPGVYAFVSWFVAVQTVVLEDSRGVAALGRSHELVRGSWWRVLGIALVIMFMAGLASALTASIADWLADRANLMVVYLAGYILGDAILYSFTALAGTLLYFDLRARSAM